jgi:hypothetical protein
MMRFVRTVAVVLGVFEALWTSVWALEWFFAKTCERHCGRPSNQVLTHWLIGEIMLAPLIAFAILSEVVDGHEARPKRGPLFLKMTWGMLVLLVCGWIYVTAVWFDLIDGLGGTTARADSYATVFLSVQAIPLAILMRNLLRQRVGFVTPALFGTTILVALWAGLV